MQEWASSILNNKSKTSSMRVLEHICSLLASTRYQGLVVLKGSRLVISNQYIFLWSVLPRYTRQFVHRIKFIRHMRKHHFQLVNERNDDKEIIFECANANSFHQLQQISKMATQKCRIKDRLQQTKLSINQLLNKPDQLNIEGRFALLDAISSFKAINRDIYQLYQQQFDHIQKGDCTPDLVDGSNDRASFTELSNMDQSLTLNHKMRLGQFYSQSQIECRY